jgi:tetratricopeptide (TPR) repeat protein
MRSPIAAILMSLVIFLSAASAGARMTREEAFLGFTEANNAFRQANESIQDPDKARELYQQAILRYEQIIRDGGIRNAGLYYNLANAYLLSDDLGRSILNYRRALQLDPADPQIQKNLAFARSRCLNQIPPAVQKKVLHRLFFWHYDWSIRTRLVIGGACFAVLCLWLTARMWTPRMPASALVYVVLILLTGAMACSLVIEEVGRERNLAGVVIVSAVTARQGDGLNYTESFTEPLSAGTEFEVLQRRTGWLQIRLADGAEAWIPDAGAELI